MKTTVHVSYYWLDGFASYIADKYDVDEYDIMRLILAPVFPGTEFTDDELKLPIILQSPRIEKSTVCCFPPESLLYAPPSFPLS